MKVLQRKAGSTPRSSQAVPHPSTDRALRRLTSEVERDPVHSTRYGRQRRGSFLSSPNPHPPLELQGPQGFEPGTLGTKARTQTTRPFRSNLALLCRGKGRMRPKGQTKGKGGGGGGGWGWGLGGGGWRAPARGWRSRVPQTGVFGPKKGPQGVLGPKKKALLGKKAA